MNPSLCVNVTSRGYIMQTLEASYKSNLSKVFSGFTLWKGQKAYVGGGSKNEQRWYNKPGDVEFMSL
jgi:hypothetical protein